MRRVPPRGETGTATVHAAPRPNVASEAHLLFQPNQPRECVQKKARIRHVDKRPFLQAPHYGAATIVTMISTGTLASVPSLATREIVRVVMSGVPAVLR